MHDLLLLLAGAIAGAALFALTLGRSALQGLNKLADAAAAIAAGDFSARVQEHPPGASGRLVDAFNGMAQQVELQMTAASQGRSRLTAVLNSSIDAALVVDEDARVLFANVAAERLFQRPADQIVGNPFVWVLANEQVTAAVRASREQGVRQSEMIERPTRQYLQVVSTPIAGGGDWAVLVVCHDLTDEKRTEQMRRDFVANVSHELRTPLAAIKSVIETLEDGAADDPSVEHDFLRRADTEVDRLIQLVEELLELSRIESGVPLTIAPVDLASLLGDVVERLQPQAERKGVEIDLDVEADLGIVHGDGRRLERAVVNLLHNAIKFTPEGGRVTVGAERDGDGYVIRVSDTGIGIAPENLPRIFERFYKVDQSRSDLGSGLGLAVVKHTVEAHGGHVSAESALGRGSSFSLTLPSRF